MTAAATATRRRTSDEPGRARSRDTANSVEGDDPYERLREARSRRWALVNFLQRETALERVSLCRKHRTFVAPAVRILIDQQSFARYGGLQTCGSVWACPLCSATIRQRRVEAVERVGRAHLAAGGSLVFLTLTLPHDWGDDLRHLLDTIRDGWRHVQQGATWRRVKDSNGIVGCLVAVEVTHGYNGWHPHLHLLVFIAESCGAGDREAVREAVERRWRDYAVRRGYRAPSADRGAVWKPVRGVRGADALAAYLVKVQDGREAHIAVEMLRGDLKRGRSRHRTPFQLLEVAMAGGKKSKQALALWHEYERVTKGRLAMTGLASLLKRYAVDDDDDDQALAESDTEQHDDDRVLIEFGEGEWRNVVRYKRRGHMLRVAEDQGLAGVTSALSALNRRVEFDRKREARNHAKS